MLTMLRFSGSRMTQSRPLCTKDWPQRRRKDLALDDWVKLVLKCGEVNLRTMEILDAANTGTYGQPVPTKVPLGAQKGKAILVSGHDLKDLEELLKQTDGKGINVYTHGEMLPTHAYPNLKKYAHFYGHFGTAWQNQIKEFADFPGAILMTTNCLMRVQQAYQDNIFTCRPCGMARSAPPPRSELCTGHTKGPCYAGVLR